MHEVLLTEDLATHDNAIYDKNPGPAYVIDGARFASPGRGGPQSPYPQDQDPGERVVESTLPHRVHVPMAYVRDLTRSVDDLTLTLIQHVAELGNWVDYEEDFQNIRDYFACADLPFRAVVRHPSLSIRVPPDIKVVEHVGVPRERFYCLTFPELLGRLPSRQRGTTIAGADAQPISVEQKGFLIFNPAGILTAFV